MKETEFSKWGMRGTRFASRANKIKARLEKHPKPELFFLLPYSTDLNALQSAWWYMRKKITHI